MKKHLKPLFIILFNILLSCFLFFICDLIVYKHYANIDWGGDKTFNYKTYFPEYMVDLEGYFLGKDNTHGRKPDGLKYKNKDSIIIFGCSYALGQYLNYNQTFSYKLAEFLKRPVYNRAISAGSFQHMYMQTISDSLYKTVTKSPPPGHNYIRYDV